VNRLRMCWGIVGITISSWPGLWLAPEPALARSIQEIMAETTLEAPADPVLETEPEPNPTTITAPIPSVANLTDVQPNDWAFQALQSLVERYSTIIGYPDRSFRGNQSLTRQEFAAGLNAALLEIESLMQKEFAQYATQKDLEDLRRLQAELAKELAIARGLAAANGLDRLKDISFYEITKLNGEVNVALSGLSGEQRAVGSSRDRDRQITFSQRVKLELNTSFFGKDLLSFSYKASNLPNFGRAADTDMARLGLQGDSDNLLELDELSYRFPVGPSTTLRLIAAGGSLTDFAKPLNSFLDDTGEGAISRFAQRNPIFRQGSGAGIGISHRIGDTLRLSLGHLADDANDPSVGFNQDYGSIAQITLSPSDRIDVSFTYVRSYNSLRTGTGSRIANDPFRGGSRAVVANSYGFQTEIGLTSDVFLSGWVGWTQATATDLPGAPQANSFNWAATLAIPDLGGDGNLLGFAIGQPPKVTHNDFTRRGRPYVDADTSLHFEAFYRWRIVDNFTLTAGVFLITRPEHSSDNAPLYIGTLRSTFNF
jgi:hypothetical protein